MARNAGTYSIAASPLRCPWPIANLHRVCGEARRAHLHIHRPDASECSTHNGAGLCHTPFCGLCRWHILSTRAPWWFDGSSDDPARTDGSKCGLPKERCTGTAADAKSKWQQSGRQASTKVRTKCRPPLTTQWGRRPPLISDQIRSAPIIVPEGVHTRQG